MPYFDMLQFSESLTQQISTAVEIEGIYKDMCELLVESKNSKEKIEKPKRIKIEQEIL